MTKAGKAIAATLPEVKRLEKENAALRQRLEDMRLSRFVLPTGPPTKKSKRFCRVIIPDTHGNQVDPLAWRAFLGDLEAIQPAEIVWLGDHLDCCGFLNEHDSLYIDQMFSSDFVDDVEAANAQLNAVAKIVPKARQHYLEGNHEWRIERHILKRMRAGKRDAEFIRTMFSPEVCLGIDKRNITYYRRATRHNALKIPGIIQIGHCYFMHGQYTCLNAAKKHVDEYVCNVVYGHTHRADTYMRRTIRDTYGAFNPGCLCEIQQYYMHQRNTHHTHGYGLQGVGSLGEFLHINVPIIDGVSYLQPLAKEIGS